MTQKSVEMKSCEIMRAFVQPQHGTVSLVGTYEDQGQIKTAVCVIEGDTPMVQMIMKKLFLKEEPPKI